MSQDELNCFRIHFSEKSIVVKARFVPLQRAMEGGEVREEIAPAEKHHDKAVVIDYSEALYFEEVEKQ